MNDNEARELLEKLDGLREAANQPLWNSTTDAAYTLALLDHYPTLATALRERLGEPKLDVCKVIPVDANADDQGFTVAIGSLGVKFFYNQSDADTCCAAINTAIRAASPSLLAGEGQTYRLLKIMVRAEALEEAAKVAEGFYSGYGSQLPIRIADQLRALKSVGMEEKG